MADREVQIKITGRNLSGPAFEEAKQNVSGFSRESTSLADKMKGMIPSIGGIGTAIAGAFAIGSVVAAGKKVLDFAGDLTDLSAKLGMSTTTIQKFQLAFDPAGVSIDTVGKAASELANKVVSGDKSAIAALAKLGLNADALKKMSMEDMFIEVADAVGGMQNKAEQIYASKTLFGKGGVEMLAALDGKLRETTDGFESMGLIIDSQTVKAADDFGDQLGLMGKQLMGIVASIMGPLLPALSGLASMLSAIAGVVGDVIGFVVKLTTGLVVGLYGGVTKMLSGLADLATKIPLVGKHLGFMGDAAETLRQQSAGAWAHVKELARGTEASGTAAAAARPQLLGLGEAQERVGKSASAAAKEQERLATLQASAFGTDTIAKARDLVTAIGGLPGVVKMSADQAESLHKLLGEALDAALRNGQTVPLEWTRIHDATRQAVLSVHEFNRALGEVRPPTVEIGRFFGNMTAELRALESSILPGVRIISEAIPEALTPPPSKWDSFFSDISATIRTGFGPTILAAITGGGDVGKSIGAFLGDSITKNLFKEGGLGAKLQEQVSGLFGKSGMGKWMGEAIGSFLPGIGPLVMSFLGPLAGKVASLFKNMFASEETLKVNQPRDQFFESFGGFEGLATSLGQVVDGAMAESLIKAVFDARTEAAFTKAKHAILDLVGPLESVRATSADTGAAAARSFTDVDAEVQALTAAIGTSDRGLAAQVAGLGVRLRDAAGQGLTDFAAFGAEVERLRTRFEDATGTAARGFEDVWHAIEAVDAAVGEDQHGLSREIESLQRRIEEAARAGVTDFAEFGAAIDDIKARIAEPVEMVVTQRLEVAESSFTHWGGRQTVHNMIDDFIRGNPGDWGRIPSALGIPLHIAMAAMGAEWGGRMHDGGLVRAHSGMFVGQRLAHDEVPIIAQTGEGILSRRGMAALGGPGALNSLNRGGGMGRVERLLEQLVAAATAGGNIVVLPVKVSVDEILADGGQRLRRWIQDGLDGGGYRLPQRAIAARAR